MLLCSRTVLVSVSLSDSDRSGRFLMTVTCSCVAVTEGDVTLTLAVVPEMAPVVQLLVYSMLPSETVIAHSMNFPTEKCFRNQVCAGVCHCCHFMKGVQYFHADCIIPGVMVSDVYARCWWRSRPPTLSQGRRTPCVSRPSPVPSVASVLWTRVLASWSQGRGWMLTR